MSSLSETWPDALPLPLEQFSGQPQHPTIASQISSGGFQRRSRGACRGVILAVSWVFTPGQYSLFRDFVRDDLGNGSACFSLDLRYPKKTALAAWIVRFEGELSVTPDRDRYLVQASLLVLRPEIQTFTPSAPVGWEPFMVLFFTPDGGSSSESASGSGSDGDGGGVWAHEEFWVQPGTRFEVKI